MSSKPAKGESSMTTKPIPDNYHSITPYLGIDSAAAAIDFYKRAFNAIETFRLPTPDGKVAHAELMFGDSVIMLSDPCEESPLPNPKLLGGSPVGLHLYVNNVDETFAQAIEAGATEISAVEDQFYGDRLGALKDPFGHVWFISTHIEDLTPEEIGERAIAMFK